MTTHGNQGGSQDQHVKPGQQDHKTTPPGGHRADEKTGTHEQHVKPGQQSPKHD